MPLQLLHAAVKRSCPMSDTKANLSSILAVCRVMHTQKTITLHACCFHRSAAQPQPGTCICS
jgi:hypothetical protein